MSKSAGTEPLKRAAPHRINREVVIQAGLAAFAANGFNGASMREIAAEARTSLSNLYNYFPSKTYLLAQILLDTGSDLYQRLDAAAAGAIGGPTERLTAAVDAYIGFIVDRPLASLVGINEIRYLSGPARQAVTEVRDRTDNLFRRLVEEGCGTGDFRTEFPRDAARAIVTMCSSMSTWYRPDGALGQVELSERYVQFSLGIVQAL